MGTAIVGVGAVVVTLIYNARQNSTSSSASTGGSSPSGTPQPRSSPSGGGGGNASAPKPPKGGGGNKQTKPTSRPTPKLTEQRVVAPKMIKQLPDGRTREYGPLKPARNPGEMAGARKVKELNPRTGLKRYWYETLDQQGRIRIVRPFDGKGYRHYYFD